MGDGMMEEVSVPFGGIATTDIHGVHDWLSQHCRHFAAIWIGDQGDYGRDLFQYNGLFKLVGDEEAAEVLNGMVARARRERACYLRVRFEDRGEAMLFKLTFGGD